MLRSLGGIAISCLFAGFLMFWTIKLFPVLPPMSHMLDQPRVGPQQSSRFFRDGRSMRMPVHGTVARGSLPLNVDTQDAAASLTNPLPRTQEVLATGKQKFTERCAVCHGSLANGVGSLTAAYGAKPAPFVAVQASYVSPATAMSTSAGPSCTTCGLCSARRMQKTRMFACHDCRLL